MIVLIIFTMSTVVFWALFGQAAASMTLFADRVMDRNILGTELTAAQFGALVYGAGRPDEAGLVAGYWMVPAYLLHTMGELCLSPVGLSAVTNLAVPSVVGVMMGSWFLATAYSEFVAAQLASWPAGRY
jgi:POT family proton-dependent oligopeptide transporter